MKKYESKNLGITLVALVITIVILLILAGISISTLTNTGIFQKAKDAKENNRIASIEEQINLWLLNNEMDSYGNSKDFKDLEDFTSDLVNNNLLTEKERQEVLTTGQITLNGKSIIFEKYNYVSNKEDLEKIREEVNNGNSFKNEKIILSQDIDLNGSSENKDSWWIPIGSNENQKFFEGSFDGNNHIITNMYTEVSEGNEFISFISVIRNSSIKNLTVEGTIILDGHDENGNDPAGSGIVGVGYGKCKIINCKNNVNVSKKNVGRETTGVLGCAYVNSDITIEKCVNAGTIKGANAVGGIIGTVYGTVIINDSYNQGELGSFDTPYVAGIIARVSTLPDIGTAKNVEINNSYNKGNLKTQRRAGGIIAFCSSGTLTINNSYNSGEIQVANADATSYLGGIVGRTQQPIEKCIISNSYNISNIYSEKQSKNIATGGILGGNNSDNTTIINCYNTGSLNGDYTAGIAGFSAGTVDKNSYLQIINSYNSGEIVGRKYAGGITRESSYTKIDVKNAYYLKADNLVGIQNSKTDESTSLTEEYMKSEDFAKELNNNISNINMNISINNWKYSNNNYPTF